MPQVDLRKGNTPNKDPNWASESEVSQAEKDELIKTGWKSGDKVPRPVLEAIRADLKKGAETPQTSLPENEQIRNYSDLSPEEKEKVNKSIKEAQATPVEITTYGDASLLGGMSHVLDSGVVAIMSPPEPKKTSASQPTKPTHPAKEEVVSAGGAPELTNCPHCGHNLAIVEDIDVEPQDRWSFVQAVLGGLRFKKQYSLMDGQMRVTFRSLTTNEADVAFTQAALDNQKTGIPDEQTYFRTLLDYRMAMSIESVESVGGVFNVPETLSDDFKTDTPPKGTTKLCFIVPYIYENVLKTENLRRMIGAQFFRFQRLVEKLEARADQPDFWKATGQQS